MSRRPRHAPGRALVAAGLSLGLAAAPPAAGLAQAASLNAPAPADDAADDETAPQDPDDVVARASLEVDTSDIGAQSPVLLRRIEELGDIELRRAEILPSRGPRDPVIKLVIVPIDGGGYAIRASLEVADETVANSEREVLCTLCTEGETVERARVEVDRLIPFVRDQARAAAEAEADAKPRRRREPARQGGDRTLRLDPLSAAGVGLLVGGVVSLSVGLPLALRAPTVKPEMPLETLDTRVPGYVITGIGGALLVTGVALLITGRRRAQHPAVALAPSPGGLLLTGRF